MICFDIYNGLLTHELSSSGIEPLWYFIDLWMVLKKKQIWWFFENTEWIKNIMNEYEYIAGNKGIMVFSILSIYI